MTADLSTNEFIMLDTVLRSPAVANARRSGAIFHEYGRLAVGDGASPDDIPAGAPLPDATDDLTLTERLGRDAFFLRSSDDTQTRKAERRFADLDWGQGGPDGPMPIHPPGDAIVENEAGAPTPADGQAPTPLSARLSGRIAVGTVIVSGPADHLVFDSAKQTHVVSEIQNGLSYLASQAPLGDVTFVHQIMHVTVTTPEVGPGTTYEHFEAPWRNAALAALGMPGGLAGADNYARKLRTELGTKWAYVAFFTRYQLRHFAYASINGPRLVFHYDNDGWGPDQIDRVFAHETCHIFGAPDEYAEANCNCGGSWGHFGLPNSNCVTCAPGGGETCIMRTNAWEMCDATKYHLGYEGLPQPAALNVA